MARSGDDGGVPRFDRRFFDGSERFTRIGGGSLGGKAAGLAFMRDVLVRELDAAAYPGVEIAIPTSAVVATDHFDRFMERNGLRAVVEAEPDDKNLAAAFQRAELPVEMVGDLRALIEAVRTPLAVRSSSLLEDALYRPFAGVYATKMIPNNQLDPDTRFRRLAEAVKFVYASTYFRAARDYRVAAGKSVGDEKMAAIIQEVVGRRHGDRFYPGVSGVARSYNFYPTNWANPEDGVVNLALGLGKTIVDGGVAWNYSPAQPRRTPPFGSIRQYLAETQTRFWAVNMGAPPAYDPINEVEYLTEADIADAEEDGALRYVASTYDGARDRVVPGIGADGPRILNFAPLLTLGEFPLNEAVRALLAAAERALSAKVEIEFAASFVERRGEPTRVHFGFLQVRPMVVSTTLVDLPDELLDDPRALAASEAVMGNGVDRTLRDVVYVRPDRFESSATPEIAAELEVVNRGLVDEGRGYLLIGFGRWGSSHASLGIPVAWSQISGARAIVEASLPEMNVEPSQGSHFFHNLSSFGVAYFTVRHEGPRRIDWAWLDAQPAAREGRYTRHVRLAAPLDLRVDGRRGRGVVLAPRD
ncbi:MAG: PEP/pyruvate-binding domain-containing protein [Candidatus Polarisedimenticolia bacterium]